MTRYLRETVLDLLRLVQFHRSKNCLFDHDFILSECLKIKENTIRQILDFFVWRGTLSFLVNRKQLMQKSKVIYVILRF